MSTEMKGRRPRASDARSGSSDAGVSERESTSLTAREFELLSGLIKSNLGIQFPESKRLMLESRILRRMRKLSLSRFGDYCRLLEDPRCAALELTPFLDLATTNKTSFFRELPQMEHLAQQVFPVLAENAARQGREFNVWSAACSTGQEVWTLCMIINELCQEQRLSVPWSVLGSDVSTQVLSVAKRAKYSADELEEVPLRYQRYLMRGKGDHSKLVRVVPELRSHAGFFAQNLIGDRLRMGSNSVDVVLLRNALIYFARPSQLEIVGRVVRTVRDGGVFVVSLTETLHGGDLPLTHVGSSIYQKGDSFV